MGHDSAPEFVTFHALRIKGLATTAAIAEMTMIGAGEVEAHLHALVAPGYAKFREQRELWQVTPDGRVAHKERLAADLAGADLDLDRPYASFLELNTEFKALCGAWQLRGGVPNDHQDAAHDRRVIEGLRALHERVAPVLGEMERQLGRLGPYAPRLATALSAIEGGQTSQFTGVMCASYHDVWMELHEDLLLTQRIDRAAEGSY